MGVIFIYLKYLLECVCCIYYHVMAINLWISLFMHMMYCTYISVYFYISLCVLSHFSVPRCPDDFVAHNGSCYHFSPNAGTIWEMNLLYCLGLAEFSTLGWSTNEQEQAFYVSNFQSTSGESIFIWIKYLFSIVFIFFIYTYISIL